MVEIIGTWFAANALTGVVGVILSGGPASVYDEDVPAPEEALQQQQFQGHMVEAINQLPEREKLIMSLYYEQELNLREIGAVLDVSESRVSQLLSQAHARLRKKLRDHVE